MNYKQSYLNLSDLFTLYYKGTSALRQGVTAPAGPPICNQRRNIFSEFFGFLYSNGNYQPPNPWMPDHPTAWENIKEKRIMMSIATRQVGVITLGLWCLRSFGIIR